MRRDIFKYWDGRRTRRVDPLVAYRALKEDPKLLVDEHPKQAADASTPVALREEAIEICTDAARRAFSLAPYSDKGWRARGVTDTEALAIFFEFGSYLSGLKKNTGPSPILSPTTPPTGSSAPQPDESATKPPLESGSIPSASDTAEPDHS